MVITTYSMWRQFCDCRQKYRWRYVDGLVPLESGHALRFGSAIHQCLEVWHRGRDREALMDYIGTLYPERWSDPDQRADHNLATAMMRGYMDRYPVEEFDVIALERTFEGPIVNPATDAPSLSFSLAGRVDGVVGLGGKFFLLEHKTASVIDSGYIERLWTDFQIILYSHYVEQTMGVLISGIIYNILAKTRLRQGRGETEPEFEARRHELIIKSKSGKSSAKRKMPESDDDYQARLAEWYAQPDAFQREIIYIDRSQIEELQAELWELTQSLLHARRRDIYYKNNSQCFTYGKPCPYYRLCASGGNPNVVENMYRVEAPHQELAQTELPF